MLRCKKLLCLVAVATVFSPNVWAQEKDEIGTFESIDFASANIGMGETNAVTPQIVEQLTNDDPAFAKYIAWNLLANSSSVKNVDAMTDVVLQLAEAERILMRSHNSGISSGRLFAIASTIASKNKDEEALKRLDGAAKSLKKDDWIDSLKAVSSLTEPNRAASPKIAISDLDANDGLINSQVTAAIETASLTNDRSELEALKTELKDSSTINEELRSYLVKQIDDTLGSLQGESDAAGYLLSRLTSDVRGNTDVMGKRHPTGITYAKMAEVFYAATVFPPSMEVTYKGITVGVDRKNVICERFETNGKKGYWITCRAKYEGFVKVLGKKIPVGADRVRVYYDNGGIRVDLGGAKGALNTRSIGAWVKSKF